MGCCLLFWYKIPPPHSARSPHPASNTCLLKDSFVSSIHGLKPRQIFAAVTIESNLFFAEQHPALDQRAEEIDDVLTCKFD